jgi:hypothetical protein
MNGLTWKDSLRRIAPGAQYRAPRGVTLRETETVQTVHWCIYIAVESFLLARDGHAQPIITGAHCEVGRGVRGLAPEYLSLLVYS